MPCARSCVHGACTALCSEPCSREPCTEHCKKRLSCGHPCIGLCGEPCPEKCATCDNEEVTETFFGDEDEDDARFVQLVDCQHLIHADSLDKWVVDSVVANAVGLPECPKCKAPIRKTLRYNSAINDHLKQVEKVKAKLRGEEDSKHKDKIIKEIREEANRQLLLTDDKDQPRFEEEQVKWLGDLVRRVTSAESALGVHQLKKCQQTLDSLYILMLVGKQTSMHQFALITCSSRN